MTSLTAFRAGAAKEGEDIRWEPAARPTGLVTIAGEAFVVLSWWHRKQRAYVNGLEVVGLQAVRPGDFVRVLGPDGQEVAYRVGGRAGGEEPGRGRRCDFTGLPISGQAVRCPGCGRLFKKELTDQEEACPVCKAPFGPAGGADLPGEELL